MSYSILPATKIIDFFKKHLSTIRSSRVNASILDHIFVEAYGSKMHMHEVATITSPEPSQLMLSPFDKTLIKNISKAISESNLGVNPGDDGAGVRLNFPPMTEDTRKIRIKEVYKYLEDTKVMIRNVRQDLLKTEKHKKENSEISEDDLKRYETSLQKEVDTLQEELKRMAQDKETEMMKI
jgi:ribosome recycling factor